MSKVDFYKETFENLGTDIYDFLLELGQEAEPFPDELRTLDHFVNGCQSQVWIVGFENSGKLSFIGDSDSFMVRGIIFVVCDIVNDMDDPTQVDWEMFKPLTKYFTTQRQRGIQAIINRVRHTERA
jgi:cysteine desulfuration protein SufE